MVKKNQWVCLRIAFFHQGNVTIRSVWGRLHTQVQAGGRAPLSSLEIRVPGLFFLFSYDSNHLFLRLTFFSRVAADCLCFSGKIEKNEK